jgi:Spy/CpxP family protein refolding chaperone
MKINKLSMAIFAATAVLAISPAVHAQTDTNKPSGEAPARPRGGGMLTVESIDKAVTLTDEEKPKVKTAVEEYATAMKEARADGQMDRTKARTAREDLDKKMKDILTPEQLTKYQAIPRRGGGGNRNGGAGAGAPAGGATPPAAN